MPRQVFFYDPPERFVAGTVGQPGQRTFFLQATRAGRITSVALEKKQVALLAERIDELLDEVLRRSGGSAPVPPSPPPSWPTPPRWTSRSRRSSGSAPWPWPGTATTSGW